MITMAYGAPHRYWRIRSILFNGNCGSYSVKELQFWSDTSRYNPDNDTPVAAEATPLHTASNCIESAHEYNYDCSYAFDNNVIRYGAGSTSSWVSTCANNIGFGVGQIGIGYDFQTPTEVKHVRVQMTCTQTVGLVTSGAACGWYKVEWSDDFITWTEWTDGMSDINWYDVRIYETDDDDFLDTWGEAALVSRCTNGPGDNPCQNGGTAVGISPSCTCTCADGYSGPNCEIAPDFYYANDLETTPNEDSEWFTQDVACGVDHFVSLLSDAYGNCDYVCRSCNGDGAGNTGKQLFLAEYETKRDYKEYSGVTAGFAHGKCCINGHHKVCQQLMKSYKDNCDDTDKGHDPNRVCSA